MVISSIEHILRSLLFDVRFGHVQFGTPLTSWGGCNVIIGSVGGEVKITFIPHENMSLSLRASELPATLRDILLEIWLEVSTSESVLSEVCASMPSNPRPF